MTTQNKALIGLALGLLISLAFNAYLFFKPKNNLLGVNSQYDLPCIYNAGTRTLNSGDGTAFTCDAQGRAIVSN